MKDVASEAQEQRALFQWIAYNAGKWPELRLCFHVPNGGSRNPLEAHNLKLQGVRPGVPDIMLPVPRGGFHGLFIELKRCKGGRVSEDQQIWIDRLNRLGYRAVICRGWDAARAEIELYLRGDNGAHPGGV